MEKHRSSGKCPNRSRRYLADALGFDVNISMEFGLPSRIFSDHSIHLILQTLLLSDDLILKSDYLYNINSDSRPKPDISEKDTPRFMNLEALLLDVIIIISFVKLSSSPNFLQLTNIMD